MRAEPDWAAPAVSEEAAEAQAEVEAAEDAASTFLTFDLDGQTLGVAVRRVREILDLQPMTRLPNAPHEVRGVIDVRGASVPILDLACRLGMGGGETGEDTRVIVFESSGGQGRPRPVGVLADRVRDVRRIDREAVEAPPELGAGRLSPEVMIGLARLDGALVVLVDLDRLFADSALDFA
jgi:purine-binding chemotaxis protein CheW